MLAFKNVIIFTKQDVDHYPDKLRKKIVKKFKLDVYYSLKSLRLSDRKTRVDKVTLLSSTLSSNNYIVIAKNQWGKILVKVVCYKKLVPELIKLNVKL